MYTVYVCMYLMFVIITECRVCSLYEQLLFTVVMVCLKQLIICYISVFVVIPLGVFVISRNVPLPTATGLIRYQFYSCTYRGKR